MNKIKKILLPICISALFFALFFALLSLVGGNLFSKNAGDFDAYSQQLSYLNENYDCESRIIVISEREIEDENCIASASGFGGLHVLQYASKEEAERALNYYRSQRYVESVMQDYKVSVQAEEDEDDVVVLDYLSWGADMLGVESYQQAIEEKYDSKELPDVYVAVLDTGIDTDNEFLRGRIAYDLGKSFYTSLYYRSGQSEYTFEDDHMHGTHVAGTIVDLTLENVKIIPVKVLNYEGSGSTNDIISGIRYVIDLKNQGYNIVAMNMSLAAEGTGSSQFIDLAYESNILSVVAAGNDSYYVENYFPANCEKALTVSAFSKNKNYENFPHVAYFSNYGSYIDVSLPGVSILSCVPNEFESDSVIYSTTGGKYAYLSGTSMATPHGSALVALYATYLGSKFNAADVEQMLKTNSYDLGDTGRDDLFGYGVPSMDLALSDRALSAEPKLSFGEIGVANHFNTESITVGIENTNIAYSGMTYRICYTLDGSFPTVYAHSEYKQPITLRESSHLNIVIYLFDEEGYVRGHSALYEVDYFKGSEEKNTSGTGFEIDGAGVLTRYTSGLKDVVIPTHVGGVKVTKLAAGLFYGLNIRTLVCEQDVALVDYPIQYCPNLKSVTLGSTNVTYAVSHCFGLKELVLTNATEIAPGPLPSFSLGYSFLGSTTAYGCSNLGRIEAPKARRVGNYAFSYITTLKEVLFTEEMKQVGHNAFMGCTSLKEINLSGVINILSNAFMNCTNLSKVDLEEVLYIDEYAFGNCSKLKVLNTKTAQTINSYAFWKCTSLQVLDFSSVPFSNLGANTMLECYSLKTLILGSNSSIITNNTFWMLKDVTRYMLIDKTYTGSLGKNFSKFYYYTYCNRYSFDNFDYYIYANDLLFSATFQYEGGEQIAKTYQVQSDSVVPPKSAFSEECEIIFLSWRMESDGSVYRSDEEFFVSQDDVFTLLDYNAYYGTFAEQAKQEYAAQYQKFTGKSAVESDPAVEEVYRAFEQACTVEKRADAEALLASTDRENVLQRVNEALGEALCKLLDEFLAKPHSEGMAETVGRAKESVMGACNSNLGVVGTGDAVDAALAAIEAQHRADKTAAMNSLRERTGELYEGLSPEGKALAEELYAKYGSKIDAAEYAAYESIVVEGHKEFLMQNGKWTLDDFVSAFEDEQIFAIADRAKTEIDALPQDELSETELELAVQQIVDGAKAEIEEYLASQEEPPKDPDDSDDPDDPDDPNDPDDPDDPSKEPETPDEPSPEKPGDSDDETTEPEDNDRAKLVAVLIAALVVLVVAGVAAAVIVAVRKKNKK